MRVRFPRPVLAPIAAGLAVSTFAAAWTIGPAGAATIRGSEWWLAALGTRPAWTIAKGAGTTVAVLGDGVVTGQPDLAGSVIAGPNMVAGAPTSGPYFGKFGTGLASLIAGHGHGRGDLAGIMGIAPEAKILSVRVTLPAGDPLLGHGPVAASLPAAIAAGIQYAVHHGATVIDLPIDPGQAAVSGTGGAPAAAGGSAAERAAVQYALSHDVVLVAPAGDNGTGTDAANYPAAYPGVISVGSFDRNFVKAAWSSKQSYVTVTAAGTGVVAAANNHSYQTISSTSAASAMVAGIAALIRSRYPSLSVAQVRESLVSSTVFNNKTPGSGHGSVNAVRALDAAARLVPAGPPAGAGAQPLTVQSPPQPAQRSLLGIIAKNGVVSAGLLAVLLLLIGAQAVIFGRRGRRKRQPVTEWSGRQAQSRYPHAGPGAASDPMLAFFASPVAPPATSSVPSGSANGGALALPSGSARMPATRGQATTASGLFAGVSRPPAGTPVSGRPVASRLGSAPPASAAGTSQAPGRPGGAAREASRRPSVSGTPPWEPAPRPDGALPWAAATGQGLPRSQSPTAGPAKDASSTDKLPAPAARAERLSRANAARQGMVGQAVQMAQASQLARRARQAQAGASMPEDLSAQAGQAGQAARPGEPLTPVAHHAKRGRPAHTRRAAQAQRGNSPQSPQPSSAFRSAAGQPGATAPRPASGDVGGEAIGAAEQGSSGSIRQSLTGRLEWREAGSDTSPLQQPGAPLPVRQPRRVSQPAPMSPSGSLWERAVQPGSESGERLEGQDSGSRPIYVWNPEVGTETFPGTPTQLADYPRRELARPG